MTDLPQAMPLLASQEGIRESRYRYYDADGTRIDEEKVSDSWEGY
jgi:hypothetical protein